MVDRVDGDRHLGRLALVHVRAQLVADPLLLPVHGGFGPGTLVVSRCALPPQAPVPGNALEVAIPLRRCASGRAAQHRGRTSRDDHGRFRMALGHTGVDAILVVGAYISILWGGSTIEFWPSSRPSNLGCPRLCRGAQSGLERQSGFVRAAPSGA